MTKISLSIDDNIYQHWEQYAKQAGLPLDALILEATRFSVQTDRLGVDTARVQELLRVTREAELQVRLQKTKTTDNNKQPKTDTKPTTDDSLQIAQLHPNDDTVNMADLEEVVARDI